MVIKKTIYISLLLCYTVMHAQAGNNDADRRYIRNLFFSFNACKTGALTFLTGSYLKNLKKPHWAPVIFCSMLTTITIHNLMRWSPTLRKKYGLEPLIPKELEE